MTAPVDLTLVAEHRRGHGAMYDALNNGTIDVPRLRQVLAGLPMPQAADGRLVLAVDVSSWLRPDAPTSAERLFCHVYGRSGRSSDQFIPGWPYSFVAALESSRTSWCQLLDAVRLGPVDDVAEVTAAQVRRVVTDLIEMGRWHAGDRDILIVFDAGYDAPRMAHLLDGLPVEVLGRMRSDRVMRRPTPSLKEYALAYPQGGRPPKHGKEFRFARPETWGEPDAATVQVTDRYGTARAMAWDRIHPRLTTRSAWIDHTGELPIVEGTLIRLQVDRLPGGSDPLPLWLWSSKTGMTTIDVDIRWQVFLRRFDLEHTFRLMKQTLGWSSAPLRLVNAGPGSSSPPTPSSASSVRQRPICDGRGRSRPSPADSLRPEPAGGSGTSVPTYSVRPMHPNPQHPALEGQLARRSGDRPPATTWAGP